MQNKTMFCLFAGMLIAGLNAMPASSESDGQAIQPDKTDAIKRIGVYDSRAIAIVYAGSEFHIKLMQKLIADSNKAKAEGNKKVYAELRNKTAAQQKLLHLQGFSTAPVDNILENIRDKLPEIIKKAEVKTIISKWDKATLEKYKSAERIDITMELARAFNPNERALRQAIEIQEKAPISLDIAEKIKD